MAGAGYKLFTTGSVLTAAEVNTYLQEQTVMVFADATARTTALSGVVAEGMLSYLKDTDVIQYYNGSSWTTVNTDQTPLTTKGDLFTYSTADARLAVGNNGETLVADSSQSTGLRWGNNYGFTAGKNVIINGDFRINQRSFSSSTTSGAYGFDRWFMETNTATQTYSAQTFTAGTAPVAGYEGTNLAQVVTTNQSGGAYCHLVQRVEDVRTFANRTITISFWAKANSGTPTIGAIVGQNFGSGGSATVLTNASAGQAISTSWARYSFTIAVPSISGKTIGTGSSLEIRIAVSDGVFGQANNTFQIWGVQAETGSVATAFQTATGTLAGELAACQRYYEKSYALATAIGTASVSQAFNGFYTVGSNQKMVNPGIWKVQKRTSPTVTVYDDAGNSGKISTLDTGGTATNNVAIAIIDTDDTSFRALGSSNGTQAGYKWNWVASAEL